MKCLLECFQNMLPCNFHYWVGLLLRRIILFFFLNKLDSVLVRWMNLEPIIQSEVSQKEKKNKYFIIMHKYGIQKNSIDEPICRAGIGTQT